MPKVAIIISPNWRDYGKKYLPDCITSLRQQTFRDTSIFLIDNESSDESFAYLKELVPEAHCIIREQNNEGFAKANNDAIKKALEENFDHIILFNIDTIVDPKAVEELVRCAELDPDIGAVQARLMLWPEKEKVNSIGNATHFLGFGFSNGYKDIYSDTQAKEIFYPSGAAVLYKADALKKAGLFDEEFWMYAEDQDLGWRIWLCGYKCLLAKDAIVYHKYEFSRSTSKYYWMDRNRLIVVLKNYGLLTLAMILPALMIMECGLLYFSFRNGWLKEKLRIYAYFFNIRNWRYIWRARQESQAKRTVKDSRLKNLFSSSIGYQEIESPALSLANKFFGAYWSIIKKFI